ncbi:MAG: hydrogenase 4 subunit B [Steroidobacteraceae bacterium]|jgi:formate hydrogenlyase subunit 3/multisubunit Na+/H+ antiporter MnhD subunit|nr:hydrogenase 4 subunit B [Pseudomonadota bacterium]MBP7609689.1 hydrogenase 4 subunit B [Steroidobacteraceae bacterium]MBP9130555.1 hydrogenase 4 subunit B [Steroidobacteraceae bacterium]
MAPIDSPLTLSLALLACWAVVGAVGLLRPHSVALVRRVLFPLGALIGVGLAIVAALSLAEPVEHATLHVGLPDLPMHVRLDNLSRVFLALLGSASAGVSLFAAGYFRKGEGTAPGVLGLQYHLFLASMGFVLVADDAYAFMVAWETMALTSYFLVTAQHGIPEIRSAGFLYLLMAHVGAIAILLSFGILQGGTWLFSFDAMRASTLSTPWATAAFLLALFGFGAKAGLLPLHVWLPEAHPAAPSPVSALMSGVMLKTAIYGVLRVTFDLIGDPLWWWGLIPLALGLATAIFGVVFAAVQTDMKRLLAYSSVENIGVLFTGIGLAIVFHGVGMTELAALALIAVLYHSLNHAFMKSLLFLGTGAVLHATGERNLGRLGGLIHRMPWAAWLTLVGVLAIAGLPPLNGFVSEWLLLQTFLFSHEVPQPFVNMLLPLGAAIVALAAALAGYVMVKFFGIVFLGQPRESSLAVAHDVDGFEKAGLVWLAIGCVLLGLLPSQVIHALGAATGQLIGAAPNLAGQSWWMLAPLTERDVSYAPLVLLAVIVAVIAATFLIVRVVYRRPVRRAPTWDCGFGHLDPRMQDTAEGFGQPIRHIFVSFFEMERDLPSPLDQAPRYRVKVSDRFWQGVYLPIAALLARAANSVAWLQQGRISVYLTYSFITLVVLLAVML